MKAEITLNDKFGRILRDLCAQNDDIKLFLEIGTGSGNGSTLCIIEGMNLCQKRKFRKDVKLISIEANQKRHNDAIQLLGDKKNLIEIELLLGASLTIDDLPPLDFFTKTPISYKKYVPQWYLEEKEVLKHKNNVLRGVISKYKRFDVVLIDGSGFLGRAEFKLLKDRCKYIALDDTNQNNSYKNHLNRQEILANSEKWTVIEDNLKSNCRGWMVAVNNFFTKDEKGAKSDNENN